MSFRHKSLWVLIFFFVLAGFALLLCGDAMTPAAFPSAPLSNWLHPGPLTMLAGLLSLSCGAIAMMMLGDE